MTDATAARIAELEAKLAKATHERDEYRKLYELVMMELERVKRHLRAQNGSERVDAAQVQLAFSQVAKLVVPTELAAQIAEAENNDRAETRNRGPTVAGSCLSICRSNASRSNHRRRYARAARAPRRCT